MATAFYRASDGSMGARLADLLAVRLQEVDHLPEPVAQLYARRYGRALAGLTGVTMGLAMFLSSAHEGLRDANVPTVLLFAAWLFTLAAYFLGGSLGPSVLR